MKITSKKHTNGWDEEADVVIVGAGGAGLAAAIESASAGANTMVFEKLGTSRASSTTISGGVFSFAGTDFQNKRQAAEKDTRDSDDLLYKDTFVPYQLPKRRR